MAQNNTAFVPDPYDGGLVILPQTNVVPKQGGSFWFKLAIDKQRSSNWSYTVTGAERITDIDKNMVGVFFTENTTGQDRVATCILTVHQYGTGTEYTNEWTVTQKATNDFYFSNGLSQVSDTLSGDGGNATFYVRTNDNSSNFSVAGYAINRTGYTVTKLNSDLNPVYTPHITRRFATIADFKAAAQAGELTFGEWVYVDGVVDGTPTKNSSGVKLPKFVTSGTTTPYLVVSDVYDLGNVQFTDSNYTDAANITTIGFRYLSKWTSGNSYNLDTYYVGTYKYTPFAYTKGGVTTPAGFRDIDLNANADYLPPIPGQSGYNVTVTLPENEQGGELENWVFINNGNKSAGVVVNQAVPVGSLSVEYQEMTLPANGSRTYLNEVTYKHIDFANITLTHNSGAFDIRLIQQDGKTYISVFTNTGIIGEDTPITDTITLTGTDGQGNVSTIEIPVTQSIEDGEFFSDPYGDTTNPIVISWQGDTKTFTLINKETLDSPEFTEYHLTEVTRVSWYKDGVESDLPYTAEWVDGKIQVTITFPRNTTYDTTIANLHIAAKDNFVPSSTVYMWPSCALQVEGIPVGSIEFAQSEKWVNSQTWDNNNFWDASYRFTATDVDLDTLQVTTSGDSIVNRYLLTYDKKAVNAVININNTENRLTETITVSATDYGGTVRSGQLILKQVKASEGWYFHITSPEQTSTSNRAIIGYNEDLPITFVAKNTEKIDLIKRSITNYISSFEYENVSDNQYTGTIYFDNNNTTSKRTNQTELSVSFTTPFGTSTTVYSIYFSQWTRPGSIRFYDDSITVPKNSNYRHKDAQFVYDMINGDLTPSITGDVSGTFELKDYENGHYLVFTPDENTTNNTLTGTITLSGVDYNGTAVSDSYTVTQKPYNPYLKFIPFSEDTVNILYNETSTTFQVECQGIISLDGVYVEDSLFSNAFKEHYVSGNVIKLDDTHYTLVVNTDVNNTHTPSNKGVVSATPTTEFGKNDWDSGHILGDEAFRWVRKCGIPGVISITPAVRNVDGEAGSTYFTYSVDSYMTQPISITHSGDMDITNFAIDGSRINVEYGENRSTVIKSETITASGTDYQGLTITKTATINQERLSYLEFLDTEKTIEQTESTVSFRIDDFNVTNLQCTYSGSVSITGYSFSEREGGHILTLTTADNNERRIKTSTITVTATGVKGDTLTTTAILHKNGPDGIIEVNPSSLTIPKSPRQFSVDVTTDGITTELIISTSGSISFSSVALNNSKLEFTANENATESDLTGIITLTGTDYKGKQIIATINVTQKPYDSYIELSPASRIVNREGGSVSYTITTDSVNLSTLQSSFTGSSIVSATLTENNVIVVYNESTVVATKSNTITVSGIDIYGNSVSGSAILLQTGVDPTIVASDVSIPYNRADATAFVATNGIENLSVTFSGDVVITNHSISATTGGYNINLTTEDNETNDPKYSTATVTGTVTEGQYAGETRSTTFRIIKYGKEGQIIVDKTEYTVKKGEQTLVIDVVLNNMDPSTVTSSIGTFNADKTQLTIPISANTTGVDRTITVTITGQDTNGITRTTTITITQYGIDPYINIQPSSKTISYDEAIVNFTITTSKVSGLSVSIDGPIDVTSYTLDGNTLRIVTGDNLSMDWLMDTITITGTSELGETVTATATLSKFGLGGGIIVDNSIVLGSCNSLAVIEYALDKIDPDSIYGVFVNDNFLNPTFWIDKDNRKIFFDCGTSGYEEITGTFYLYGTDEDGIPKVATIDMRQLPKLRDEQGHSVYRDLYFINKIRNVGYSAGSEGVKLEAENTTLISVTNGGTLNGVWSQNGDTYTVTYPENTSNNALYSYITFTGITSTGETIVNSAMVIQGTNASSGPYVFMLQPASQSVKRIEASANNVYYIINSYKGTENIGYGISGFVLTGIWGAKPTIAFSDGYPYVKVPLNTHKAEREAVVMFLQDGSYNTLTARIIQEEGVEPKVSPIWKDYSNSATTDSFIEYHINLDGDIIYSGKAYKYPDNSKITWSINEAVSNYLGNGIYFTDGIHQIPDYSKDFFMEVNTGDKYIETFYNSWAYKDTDYWLSDPIDFRVDQRQWLPVSFLSTNYDQITVNGRVYAALKENDGWTVMTRLGKYILDCNAGVSVIGADGNRLNYKIASGDYVLYYSNAYGGWDSLLCNGTSRKTDNIEHLNYRKKSANQSQFSKINYQNNITPTWSLNTGINVNGSKMYHLLESTMVYLHNLETNEIIPVVITNSSCDYLNYTNNGKKPYYYTITVEESNQKLRK